MPPHIGSRSSGDGVDDDDTSIIEPEQGNGESVRYVGIYCG